MAECPICYNEIQEERRVRLNCCNKECCSNCIVYLMQNTDGLRCPLCRQKTQALFVFSKETETECTKNYLHHYHSLYVIRCGGWWINGRNLCIFFSAIMSRLEWVYHLVVFLVVCKCIYLYYQLMKVFVV
jgi:hypothetical protein